MEQQTTVERFQSTVTSDNFEPEIERVWLAVSEIKDVVVRQVQTEALPPMTGLGIIACVTGQSFGYGLFHGQPAPADLLADLSTRSLSRT